MNARDEMFTMVEKQVVSKLYRCGSRARSPTFPHFPPRHRLKALRSSIHRPECRLSQIYEQKKTKNLVGQENESNPRVREGLYSALPDWLEIRVSAEEGRGIFTKQALRAACSAHEENQGSLRRCTKCRIVRYCNSECQTTDWSIHKLECAALQRWFQAAEGVDRPPGDAVRCVARLLWRRQKRRDSVWAKEIDSMQSHRIVVTKGDQIDTKHIEDQTQLAHSLVQFLGVAAPQELAEQFAINSAGELVDIISKFATNTFTLSDPSLTPIGACVSPAAALLNHSCDPNVVAVFPGNDSNNKKGQPLLEIVAIRDIKPGEQLLTAYVDTTLPTPLRQKALKETYFFTCYCHLCDRPQGVDPRESLWCPRKCGGVCPLPVNDVELDAHVSTSCKTCKTAVPTPALEEVLDAVRIGKEGLEKAESLQFIEPARARKLTSNLIPLLTSAGLSHSTYPLLALTRLNQALLIDELSGVIPTTITTPRVEDGEEVLISPDAQLSAKERQEHLDECIQNGSRVVTGLSALLVPGHPMIGIALTELGKLLAVDEVHPAVHSETGGSNSASANSSVFPPSGPARVKQAYEMLMRARASLQIGFGTRNEGGKVGKQVRENLVRLEKEIEVWTSGVKNVLADKKR
ncbi:hypothetical protein PM082_011676 [Marasmius tenuissimus]|nr:hypothetical protein PM082_011676 [Marasmius tenuissimus]